MKEGIREVVGALPIIGEKSQEKRKRAKTARYESSDPAVSNVTQEQLEQERLTELRQALTVIEPEDA